MNVGIRMFNVIQVGPNGKGGVDSVIQSYKAIDSFEKKFSYLASWGDRPIYRLYLFLCALLVVLRTPAKSALLQLHTASRGSLLRKSLIALLWKSKGGRYIIHLHGGRFNAYFKNSSAFGRYWIKQYFSNSSSIIVLSTYWASFVSEEILNGFRCKPNIYVIYNPAAAIASANEISQKIPNARFVFSGRVCEKKGAFDLIHAMSLVVQKRPDCTLDIYGDGEVGKATALIKENSLDKYVLVHSWVNHKEYLSSLKQYSVFVLPSYAEGLPVSVIEAMANGVSVIATSVGGIPELLACERGVVIQPGQIDELAKAMLALISSHDMLTISRQKAHDFATRKLSMNAIERDLDVVYRNCDVAYV